MTGQRVASCRFGIFDVVLAIGAVSLRRWLGFCSGPGAQCLVALRARFDMDFRQFRCSFRAYFTKGRIRNTQTPLQRPLNEIVSEILGANDIVDVLGQYLQLKPAGGSRFKALCPFHVEKTPSCKGPARLLFLPARLAVKKTGKSPSNRPSSTPFFPTKA